MIDPSLFRYLYVLAGVLAVLAILISSGSGPKPLKAFFIATPMVLVVLIIGLRSRFVGVDTDKFTTWVESISSIDDAFRFGDAFYYLIGYFSVEVFGGYQAYLFSTALLTLLMIYVSYWFLLKKHANERFSAVISPRWDVQFVYATSILLLISTSTFSFLVTNQARQAMAGGFVLISIYFAYQNRFFAAVMFFVPAMFSHFSSVFLVPVIVFAKLSQSSIGAFYFMVACAFLGWLNFFPILAKLVGIDYVLRKMSSEVYQGSEGMVLAKTAVLYINGTVFFFLSRLNATRVYIYLVNIYLIVVGFSSLLIEYSEGANRIQRYGVLLMPLLLLMSCTFFRRKRNTVLVLVAFSTLYFLFVVTFPSFLKNLGVN
jgi:hypothetical protein